MLRCNCTKEEYKTSKGSEYEQYRKKVQSITNRQPLYLLENFSKRGKVHQLNAHHLDHILSIAYGFHNNIEPDVIGNIVNLRMIPWKRNLEKGQYMEQESFDMFIYFINEGYL